MRGALTTRGVDCGMRYEKDVPVMGVYLEECLNGCCVGRTVGLTFRGSCSVFAKSAGATSRMSSGMAVGVVCEVR